MRPLICCLLAVALLPLAAEPARAQAGRYVPMPSPGGGGGVHFFPHGVGHGDSNVELFILIAIAGCAVVGLGWKIGQALGGSQERDGQPESAAPPPDVIHEADVVAPRAESTRRLLEELARREALFEPKALYRWVYESFLFVQRCWQKGDYEPLGDLLLPAIRAEHEQQLRAMRTEHERNLLEGLRVERLEFVHLDCPADANAQQVTALITFTAASYYVDDRTGSHRRGSTTPARFQEFWLFQRRDDGWHLSQIERSHQSARLTAPNRVEGLNRE